VAPDDKRPEEQLTDADWNNIVFYYSRWRISSRARRSLIAQRGSFEVFWGHHFVCMGARLKAEEWGTNYFIL
jgi:hypothetical protein